MSDGTTVATISPVTSEELTMMQNWFSKLANTVVQASEFGKEVEALRTQVATLNSECQSIRERNAELDAMLYDTRAQRDEAKAKITNLEAEIYEGRNHLTTSERNFSNASAELDSVQDQLRQARRDRDDAAFRNLELEEALSKANAKLEKFKALIVEDTPPVPQPVAEPTPPVPQPTEPEWLYPDDEGYLWSKADDYHDGSWRMKNPKWVDPNYSNDPSF